MSSLGWSCPASSCTAKHQRRQYNEAPYGGAAAFRQKSLHCMCIKSAACYIYGITGGTACQSDELAGKNSVFIVIVHIEELKIVVIVIIHAGKVLCGGS